MQRESETFERLTQHPNSGYGQDSSSWVRLHRRRSNCQLPTDGRSRWTRGRRGHFCHVSSLFRFIFFSWLAMPSTQSRVTCDNQWWPDKTFKMSSEHKKLEMRDVFDAVPPSGCPSNRPERTLWPTRRLRQGWVDLYFVTSSATRSMHLWNLRTWLELLLGENASGEKHREHGWCGRTWRRSSTPDWDRPGLCFWPLC